jgi:hypothetical protein
MAYEALGLPAAGPRRACRARYKRRSWLQACFGISPLRRILDAVVRAIKRVLIAAAALGAVAFGLEWGFRYLVARHEQKIRRRSRQKK